MKQGVVLKAKPFWQADLLLLEIDTSITEIVPQVGAVLQITPLVRRAVTYTHNGKTVIPCTPGKWMVLGGRNTAKFKTTTKRETPVEANTNVWYLMLQVDFVGPEADECE